MSVKKRKSTRSTSKKQSLPGSGRASVATKLISFLTSNTRTKTLAELRSLRRLGNARRESSFRRTVGE